MKHTDAPIKTYKVTDKDMKCLDFQYELGVDYCSDQPVRCGNRGFHSCLKANDCFYYYGFRPENRVFVCEIWGDYDDDPGDSKVSSQYIRLVRELTWHEVLDLVNTGLGNTGRQNSGNRNSGNQNSGNQNSGDQNSGNWNSGNQNSGDQNSGNWNSGNWNSGNRNSGDRNSGNRNSGNRNSGDYNSTSRSAGYFNTTPDPVRIFNSPTDLAHNQINLPNIDLRLTEWVEYSQADKDADPDKAMIGGYLLTRTYEEAWKLWDDTIATQKLRKQIKDLPNYDPEIFMELTGLDWREK